ncbi:MAG: PhzF family phenazine biosynthesis protein [Bacillota bacterium]|nr:PhzF family phenazine biosynthesis protein [Bacillota bacterium]
MSYPLYLVDVFAEMKYAGNQLAVVRNAEKLSANEMQKIALEMNYSETTFILSDEERGGGYDVRIFSLDEELPFAGHPTLGTAYIIQQFVIKREVEVVKLNLTVGQIPVSFSYIDEKPDVLWMKQVEPVFGRVFDSAETATALNITESQIDSRFPIEEVSTGLPFIIVPLKNLDAVRSCRIDRAGCLKLIDKAEAKSILVFSSETYSQDNQLNARMFDDYHGIAEDPATGSANGCLAAYLVKHRYFGTTAIDIRVEQGYEIGRPSLLLLKAEEEAKGVISVNVGGKVIMVARGELV